MHGTPAELRRVQGQRAATWGGGEYDRYPGFTLNGSTSLEAVAAFYGLKVPGLEAGMSVADYITKTCYGPPRAGYRLALNGVELVVQVIEEGLIRRVGLRFLPLALRHPRRRRLYGRLQAMRSSRGRTARPTVESP